MLWSKEIKRAAHVLFPTYLSHSIGPPALWRGCDTYGWIQGVINIISGLGNRRQCKRFINEIFNIASTATSECQNNKEQYDRATAHIFRYLTYPIYVIYELRINIVIFLIRLIFKEKRISKMYIPLISLLTIPRWPKNF